MPRMLEVGESLKTKDLPEYPKRKENSMKKFLALVVVCSLSVLYSPAWGQRGAAEPENSGTEPGTEQSERRESPDDSQRELKMIMLNQAINKKGNAVNQQTNEVKKAHSTEQSIINNLK